ncbi:EF-P 5-aminopentanol modification-associated protein YfmH [Oceanobacillus sp. J11TS1]|uniref:EF-P 5-aminopentanol modification-associated protein YfmH n=1 Tax=Oceanobacillus sp. J11TS1 TaxID=2807191 RepID=UPI001B221D16|nr:pitrilysin family protein [Oceanobacillus sp. J11TS1]GIO25317.1 putative zinc protease YmfH [Oceanobacillus sp. J11TS1]
MKEIKYNQLDEVIFSEQYSNGLEVFILPKKGFHKTFATFTTKYGSVDNHFFPVGKDSPIIVPDGIAHFLEHKILESKKNGIFQRFAKQGASANAFTSFTRTAYTLSATSNISKNITMLLDFVQEPYFTDDLVEKEKGIIEQEIKMYDDNPDWRARFGLLENLYKNHPAKIDIAGTVNSINQITKEDLYTCYDTFYHPNNMLLFIVGSVNPEAVIKLIRNNQKRKKFREPKEIIRISSNEDAKVNRSSSVMKFPIQIPKVFIGYKELNPMRQGKGLLKYEMILNVLLELMFGKGSQAYEKMYDKGHVDETFTFDYTNEKGFGFSVIGGDSRNPEEVIKIVNETIDNFKEKAIKKEDVQRVLKKKIGSFLSAINSPQFIANQFTRYRFNEMDLFDVLPTLENLTEKDIEKVLHLHFCDESKTTLVLKKN